MRLAYRQTHPISWSWIYPVWHCWVEQGFSHQDSELSSQAEERRCARIEGKVSQNRFRLLSSPKMRADIGYATQHIFSTSCFPKRQQLPHQHFSRENNHCTVRVHRDGSGLFGNDFGVSALRQDHDRQR